MDYGYKVTSHGRAVLAACSDMGVGLRITRCAVGGGMVSGEADLADVHELVQYAGEGRFGERWHKGDRLLLTVQYSNQDHPDMKAFQLSEFIVYAENPETGQETDFLYATLGDYRQPVPAYNPALPASLWNFPVLLVVSSEIHVTVNASPGLVTFDDLSDFRGELLRSIMMGEISLPLATSGGDDLLADDGTPIEAVYKIASTGNIMAAVAEQISAAKQEIISAQIAAHNTVSTAHPTHLAVVTKS